MIPPDKPPAAKKERPADFYHIYSLDIEPLSAASLTFKMAAGETIEGYLKVKGGNDDIRFYINDPSGARVLDVKRVQERYDFAYMAGSEGSYALNFNNGFSFMTGKHVCLHYRIRQGNSNPH